jgi:hypothetical protein
LLAEGGGLRAQRHEHAALTHCLPKVVDCGPSVTSMQEPGKRAGRWLLREPEESRVKRAQAARRW